MICEAAINAYKKRVEEGKTLEEIARELCPEVKMPRRKAIRIVKKALGEDFLIENAERLGYQPKDTIPKEMKNSLSQQKIGNLDSLGTFDIIYADPPWRYEHSISNSRSIENHYPTMSLEEICSLSIPSSENAVLFLWVTMPKLVEGLKVIEAWGFQYRTGMVWIKDKIGMGYFMRGKHELLLISRKGDIEVPEPENRPDSVIFIEFPREEHSKKPDIFYEIIEKMYPRKRYIELFARRRRGGWISWGNECK